MKKVFLMLGYVFVFGLILLFAIIAFKSTGMFDKWFDSSSITAVVKSDIDYDNDGIDDYTDILKGAKKFIESKPKYKSNYYKDGYPTDGYYVCSDIIWYSLKNAGYDFKSLIDEDIKNNQDDYDIDTIDSNIDFRRVKNIKVFLDKYAIVLDNEDITTYNPGDIVVYEDHIAIVSDKVNEDGINYILHHDGYHPYEDNGLFRKTVIGHYRWRLENE